MLVYIFRGEDTVGVQVIKKATWERETLITKVSLSSLELDSEAPR